MCMMRALHQDGTPWAGADDYDGVAIERGIDEKHSSYPELVSSDRVKFLVLVCEEGGRWSPDVYRVVKDLVDLKTVPLHNEICAVQLKSLINPHSWTTPRRVPAAGRK